MVFQFNISTTDRPNETFHLFDLARHDTIEVDGSLTRNDIYFGDDVHFDATVWAPVAKDLGLDDIHSHGRFVTPEIAAKATKNRYDLAETVNPEFNNSKLRHDTEYGTTALYLLTLWDGQNNAAPKPWVKALLGESLGREGLCMKVATDEQQERIVFRIEKDIRKGTRRRILSGLVR